MLQANRSCTVQAFGAKNNRNARTDSEKVEVKYLHRVHQNRCLHMIAEYSHLAKKQVCALITTNVVTNYCVYM